jgi:hypothetical protein
VVVLHQRLHQHGVVYKPLRRQPPRPSCDPGFVDLQKRLRAVEENNRAWSSLNPSLQNHVTNLNVSLKASTLLTTRFLSTSKGTVWESQQMQTRKSSRLVIDRPIEVNRWRLGVCKGRRKKGTYRRMSDYMGFTFQRSKHRRLVWDWRPVKHRPIYIGWDSPYRPSETPTSSVCLAFIVWSDLGSNGLW